MYEAQVPPAATIRLPSPPPETALTNVFRAPLTETPDAAETLRSCPLTIPHPNLRCNGALLATGIRTQPLYEQSTFGIQLRMMEWIPVGENELRLSSDTRDVACHLAQAQIYLHPSTSEKQRVVPAQLLQINALACGGFQDIPHMDARGITFRGMHNRVHLHNLTIKI